MASKLYSIAEKALGGVPITRDDAVEISSSDAFDIFPLANKIREKFRPKVDLCSIISAKTGACPEDCSYCAQSARSSAGISSHALKGIGEVIERARAAKASGARRFCIVTSGKKASGAELSKIADMIKGVRDAGLLPCATLGLLGEEELLMLKEAGLHRYHHNLETSRRFFPEICTTHTYEDKLKTINAVKSSGLSLCSGGIFGLGEGRQDRIDMAFELRDIGADSIPINFLVPIKGTPLGDTVRKEGVIDPEVVGPLEALEALKIISLYRFILPDREIRVCGGRLQTLGELNAFVFMAGADGLLTGDCLTTSGRSASDDMKLIRAFGLLTAI